MIRKFKTFTSLLLAILSILCLFAGCGGDSDGAPEGTEIETKRKPLSSIHINLGTEPQSDETDAPEPDEGGARLPLSYDMGSEYIEKFVFICDFQIYGLKSNAMLPSGRETNDVLTGRGGSFSVMSENPTLYSAEYGGELSLTDFVSRRKPEYLLLSVGAGDAAAEDSNAFGTFREKYIALISSIKDASPDTVIICMSLLPGSSSSGFSIYDAARYNDMILIAAEETGTYFLDVSSAFAASDGYLRPDCDGGSSRLSTTGLKKLLELIRTHNAEKVEPAPAPETGEK